jgi:predicted nucleotidyltransferase
MSARERVALEAAKLIYKGTVKEYKDAKEIAASNLGVKTLPSNYEVAIKLDELVEEEEGSERLIMLIKMRETALNIMKKLKEYNPTLIGSVWRGTPRKGSDIDIIIYHSNPEEVSSMLKEYRIINSDRKTFIINGLPRTSTHINIDAENFNVEIVVRPPEDLGYYKLEKCETYGDLKKGLNLRELEKLIDTDQLRRFIPKRRVS